MEERTEGQDIDIFSNYDNATNLNDGEKYVGKRKNTEAVENASDAERELFKKTKESPTKTENDISVWSIGDDTFFYPLGICNHCIAGVNKSVIIVWSEYSVVNFVIKKIINQKQTKTTKVRLNVPEEEVIKDVQILEFNTLLLLESGKVNYFSSAKSMHALSWLDRVRCINKTIRGFCIIRLTENRRLLLEVYEDAINMGKKTAGSVKQQYDVTFDEMNLFNCDWEDEKFTIFAVTIDAESLDFLKLLIANCNELTDQREIFFFSISGNVFVLIPDPTDSEAYQIETIFSYASNVILIKVDQKRKFCLIFLECGSIDIWYTSKIVSNRMLHQLYNTGCEYVSFTYSDSRAAFFFTDETQIVELKFIYNAAQDRFCVKETYKAIPGILACTWMETVEQLICLDCNNIFHQMSFEQDTTLVQNERESFSIPNIDEESPSTSVADYEKFNVLFELTPDRVSQLIEKSNVIQQLKNLPKDLHISIEEEYEKQKLLAISDKRNYYSKQIKAKVKFFKQSAANIETHSLILYATKNNFCDGNSFAAQIQLDIGCKEIFNRSPVQLQVSYGNNVHIFSLPCPLLDSQLQLIIPINRIDQGLIANIELFLYTFVSHANNHIAISLPIQLTENYETYMELFDSCKRNGNSICSIYSLNDLFKRYKSKVNKNKSFDFEHFLSLPSGFDFITLSNMFNIKLKEQLNGELQSFDIFIFNCNISVTWNNTKRVLHMKSNDSAAIYYFKICILFKCSEMRISTNLYQSSDNQLMMVRHQCNIERSYKASHEYDINNTESAFNDQRREELQQIYFKIRKQLDNK